MWIQLQIVTSGIALGSVVVTQLGRNAAHAKHHKLDEFELHRVVEWCEDLLSSDKLPRSNAMDDYLEENPMAHSEHFMIFDWSNLVYICSVLKSHIEQNCPPTSSSELLSVSPLDRLLASNAEGSTHPFEAVPLCHMRDALGYGFNVHSDTAARYLLSHLHHIGLFHRLDQNPTLFNTDNSADVYCVFPLPFGLDQSTSVEALVSTVEACLTDLDLSVNESIPSLSRLFPREIEAYTYPAGLDDHTDLTSNPFIEPWRAVTRVAAESKEGLSKSLQWLCLIAGSGIEISLAIFRTYSNLGAGSPGSLSDSLLLSRAILSSTWLASKSRQEIRILLSELHATHCSQIISILKSGDSTGVRYAYRINPSQNHQFTLVTGSVSFIRMTLATCLLLYGCDRSKIVEFDVIKEEDIKSLPSRSAAPARI
ncbi:hypothetical protein DXG03_006641 [Asterophora parasitica]|uniref:Uncharacterized protein n=1 Tax=Asterophora parasitica TaxID=117018 RepID=A0A9P7KDF0_9AGAR|nr:hypothetical protein DXG03_006641 [Asterophora parasitica]